MNNKIKMVFIIFLGIAGFFLITEHKAHLSGFLPFSLLGVCLLMHIFMHRKHGGNIKHKH